MCLNKVISLSLSLFHCHLYNSVDFDNDKIYCCSYGDHSHVISDSSLDDAIKKPEDR